MLLDYKRLVDVCPLLCFTQEWKLPLGPLCDVVKYAKVYRLVSETTNSSCETNTREIILLKVNTVEVI